MKKTKIKKNKNQGKLKIGDNWNAITIIALSQNNPLKAIAEFVENSIDAKAKNIIIIRGKNKRQPYLKIQDDGEGIHKDENGIPNFKYVATHICDSIKKQLKQKNQGRVLVSSVTDAYQPVEKQYEVTRRCLEQFQNSPWIVSILTKSSLVVRDIDVLKRLNCEVGFTFTTFDESIKPVFEPGSSSIEDRLTALKTIHDAHIPTYAFFGPLIPTLSDTQESLETMFDAVRTYTRYVIVDRMNFYDQAWKRVRSVLRTWNPELIPAFDGIRKDPTYETVLRSRIKKAATVPVEFCF